MAGHVRVAIPGATARNAYGWFLAGKDICRGNDSQFGHAIVGVGPSILSMDSFLDVIFKRFHEVVESRNGELWVGESGLQFGRDLSQASGHGSHIDDAWIRSLSQKGKYLFGKVHQSIIVRLKGFCRLLFKGSGIGSLVGKTSIVHQDVDASAKFLFHALTKFGLALGVANF